MHSIVADYLKQHRFKSQHIAFPLQGCRQYREVLDYNRKPTRLGVFFNRFWRVPPFVKAYHAVRQGELGKR